MIQLARAALFRKVLLCSLATLTLAACGGESGSSSAAATSADPSTAAAQANTGTIDRSQGAGTTTTIASTTPPKTTAVRPPSGSSSSGSGSSGSGSSSTGSGTTGGGSTPTTPVKSTTNGVVTLDWTPPTSNSDGSVLTNLAGYKVYYGTSPTDLSQSVKVSNPGLASYSVTGLNSGTWYFAVTSYSSDGVESGRTKTVSTTI
jgi:hypothetical protein